MEHLLRNVQVIKGGMKSHKYMFFKCKKGVRRRSLACATMTGEYTLRRIIKQSRLWIASSHIYFFLQGETRGQGAEVKEAASGFHAEGDCFPSLSAVEQLFWVLCDVSHQGWNASVPQTPTTIILPNLWYHPTTWFKQLMAWAGCIYNFT